MPAVMDFRHIRAFIAVADALSVTRAAERLNISQPPLTRHIHQLEREVGVTLFLRHRHGVTLTEAGRQLLSKARAWDAAARDFCEAARQAAQPEAERIRIGIGWGLWDVVNTARLEFAKDNPGASLEAVDAACWYDSDQLLRTGALDVAFARPPYDTAFQTSPPLFHERIQAILCADSPLAQQASVSIRDLSATPLLLWDRHAAPVLFDRILELYAKAGVSPSMVPTPGAGPYNHAGVLNVAEGKGVYLGYGVPLSHPYPSSGVAVVPVSDAGATIEVCLVSRREESRGIVARFLECVSCLHAEHAARVPVRMRTRRAS
jgi:DNA-binding transcriptional LysR family regulator